ncbi:MAG: hypothetical protein U0641_11065 [Anaerolineae bacterium]
MNGRRHTGVQAPDLPPDRHRREATSTSLPRAPTRQQLARPLASFEYTERGEAAFAPKVPNEAEALQARIAELEQFCGQLALENKLLKKALQRSKLESATA